jgi:hypothetical protein
LRSNRLIKCVDEAVHAPRIIRESEGQYLAWSQLAINPPTI